MIDFAFVESSVDIFYEWFRLVKLTEKRKPPVLPDFFCPANGLGGHPQASGHGFRMLLSRTSIDFPGGILIICRLEFREILWDYSNAKKRTESV
jgi:hypothetical protein